MAFKLNKNKINTLNHVRQEVIDRIELAVSGLSIELEEYSAMRINTYERNLIIPFVSHKCLLAIAADNHMNCTPVRIPTTYEEAAVHVLLPEFRKRLERLATLPGAGDR